MAEEPGGLSGLLYTLRSTTVESFYKPRLHGPSASTTDLKIIRWGLGGFSYTFSLLSGLLGA